VPGQTSGREEDLVGRLRRRLWSERVVLLVAVAILAGLYAGVVPGGRRVCLIAADGRPVVVVETRAQAERLLNDLRAGPGVPQDEVRFAQEVSLHDVSAVRHPVVTDLDALATLSEELDLVVRGAAILADGRFVTALPKAQEAVTVLSLLLREFSPPDPGLTPYFREQVRVEMMDVPPAKLAPSAEEALRQIIEESSSSVVHKVRSGESAWKIARFYSVSMRRLAQVNPGRDLTHIRVGDELHIPGSLLPVTVVARQEIVEPVEEGPPGRTRRVRITYENGIETKREVIGGTVGSTPPLPRPSDPPRRGGPDTWRWRDEIQL
jgi:LysM repeat protein